MAGSNFVPFKQKNYILLHITRKEKKEETIQTTAHCEKRMQGEKQEKREKTRTAGG